LATNSGDGNQQMVVESEQQRAGGWLVTRASNEKSFYFLNALKVLNLVEKV